MACVGTNCTRDVKYPTTNECGSHYRQRRTAGENFTGYKELGWRTRAETPCAVPECERLVKMAEFCIPHKKKQNRYKLTSAQLITMPMECQACGTKKSLHIDHDHSCCPDDYTCGECYRGVLCRECNVVLGLIKDKVARLEALIEYLEAV